MRLTNRKKFSLRTNDFKAKSLLDFMSSPSSGAESQDLLLFGRLIGVQPRFTNNISVAWSQIAISILVASHMDRCLKFGQLNDVGGNPTASELRQKLVKQAALNSGPKTITLKKAVKIISLLSQVQHPYWTMSPLAPACIEYNCKLPWRDDSIAKLLNVLFFVVLYEPNSAPTSAPTTAGNRRGSTLTAGSLPAINPSSYPSTPQTDRSHSNAFVTLQDGERGSSSRSMLKSSTSDFAPFSAAAEQQQQPPMSQAAQAAYRQSAKIQMLKNLDNVVKRVWSGQMHSGVSDSGDKYVLFDFLSKLDHARTLPGYARMTYEKAISLAENQSILVSELALVCIECWEVEYAEVKVAMARGKLTSKRRMGVSGNYDTSQAKLNAVERLALTRLLHWYSVEGESRGVDWEDVDAKFSDRLFPFTVPSSLMAKSRNELNHLAGVVWEEVKSQQLHDHVTESANEDGPYSTNSRGVRTGGTESLLYNDTEQRSEDDYVTIEEIERYNREQYLATQSLGYVGEEFDGYCELQDRTHETQEPHHKPVRSNSAYITQMPSGGAKKLMRRSNSSGPLHVMDRDSDDIMSRAACMSAPVNGQISTGGMFMDTLSPQVSSAPLVRPKTPLSRLPYESPAPGPHTVNLVDVLGVGESVLVNAQLISNPGKVSRRSDMMQTAAMHSSGVAETPLEHHVSNLRIVDKGRGFAPKLHPRSTDEDGDAKSSLPVVDPETEALQINETYDQLHGSHQKSRVMAARSRIKTRIDTQKAESVAKDKLSKQPVGAGGSIAEGEELSTGLNTRKNTSTSVNNYLTNNSCRITQVLVLSEFVNKHGSFTLDLTTHLTAETVVKYFSLRNTCISPKSLQYVVDNYMKPWQLEQMVRIDIDGNASLAIAGAKVLSGKLSHCCRLVHLNVSGLGMGDTGLRHVLAAIVKGQGQLCLLRLDISSNGITMVSDSFALLGQLCNLRALDISKNCFTLDTLSQRISFTACLAPLTSLQALSVSYNKIQHDGFALIVNLVTDHLHALRQLDLAGCFISSKSFSTLTAMLNLTREIPTGMTLRVSRLEEVLFQDNLFSYAQMQELQATYGARGDIKVVVSLPHLGISYPLRYDLRDYGIETYKL
eukprot:gene21698-27749_t